jgi:hypothetical protein
VVDGTHGKGYPILGEQIRSITGRLIAGLRERGIVQKKSLNHSRKDFVVMREGLLRASPLFYNTHEVIQAFLSNLDEYQE